MAKLRHAGLVVTLLLCLATWLITAAAAAAGPGQNAIASAHPAATAAGRTILDHGGNAFDAAIAVAAALAVVEPTSSGIGGGAFFLLHRASDGHQIMLDARETAPAAATTTMYLDENGEFARQRALDGAFAAAIPGLAAALEQLARDYGRLSLADSLAPAIGLARDGFRIGERYHRLARFRQEALAKSPEASGIFLVDGKAPAVGAVIVQADLANTLSLLAKQGAKAFYHGELARKLVDGVIADGGIWTLDDLANYRTQMRRPIIVDYHDIRVVSAPPPSSGGLVLAQALNILEGYDLARLSADDRMHVVVEAMRRAYRDRVEFMGDPDFFDVPVARLIDKAHARAAARDLTVAQATPSDALPGFTDQEGQDTTHFSIIDHAGNRVAATLSINYPFGATAVPPGTGVLLNNEMDDFSARPYTPNAYGLIGGRANSIEPGKRPLSSMTPTFLEAGERVAILGSPGGSRIISMVLIGTLSFAAGEGPGAWVAAKRFHHQFAPDEVQFERGGLTADQQAALTRKGHALKEISRNYGNMQAILWDRTSAGVSAASDPRGEGATDVWTPPRREPRASADSADKKSLNADR